MRQRCTCLIVVMIGWIIPISSQTIVEEIDIVKKEHKTQQDQLEAFEQLFDSKLAKGDTLELGLLYYFISIRSYNTGQYLKSLSFSDRAISSFLKERYTGYRLPTAKLYKSKALIRLGENELALEALSDADTTHREQYILIQLDRARIYASSGDYYAAWVILKQAISAEGFEEIKPIIQIVVYQEAIKTSVLLGSPEGNYIKALKEQLFRLIEPHPAQISNYYRTLEHAALKNEDYDQAIIYCHKYLDDSAISLYDLGHYNNLYLSHFEKGEIDKASFYLDKARESVHTWGAKDSFLIHANIAELSMTLGELNRAKEQIGLARKCMKGIEKENELNFLALELKLAFKKYQKYPIIENSKALRAQLRQAEEDLKDIVRDQVFQESVKGIREQSAHIYSIMIDAYAVLDDGHAVWNKIEESKGLLLLSKVNQYIPIYNSAQSTREFDSISFLYLDKMEALRNKAIEGIYDVSTLPESSNSSIINYAFGEDSLYAFHIHPSGSELLTLTSLDTLSKYLSAFYHYEKKVDDEVRKKLYQYLIKDVANDLQEEVIIIPDRMLSLIPFGALINDGDSTMISTNSISYQVSHTHHEMLRQKSKEGKEINIISPNYQKLDKKLHYSVNEAQQLNKRYRATLITTKTDRVKIKNALNQNRIIHYSGHAYQDVEDERLSYLDLGDQRLYAAEIEKISTSAEMVVLNACNTGRGRIVKGEGVFSLARNFLKAGARSVLHTLWTTDDMSSSIISLSFYKYLEAGLSKSKALRLAKLDYINDPKVPEFKKEPHYWAGMVLVGDDKPVDIDLRYSYIGLLSIGILVSIIGCFLLFLTPTKYKLTIG